MLYDLLRTRRSIRKFQGKKVEQEKIDTMLKAALMSPTSRGIKSWDFVAVTEPEILQKLSKTREHGSQFIAAAPLVIAVLQDPETCDVWVENASIAAIIIQLTAHSLGLGSCWIQIRNRFGPGEKQSGEIVKETLGIPEQYEVECLVAIGYPDEEKKPYQEDTLPYEKLHMEKF